MSNPQIYRSQTFLNDRKNKELKNDTGFSM